MIKKVYLLWNNYATDELLVIGSLEELDDKSYVFRYEKDSMKAAMNGCFLPFGYTEDVIYFDTLPAFFEQRMLKGDYNIEKFGIKLNSNNKLGILLYGNAQKNNDNFMVVSEAYYNENVLGDKIKSL